jgi:hypothetical protein
VTCPQQLLSPKLLLVASLGLVLLPSLLLLLLILVPLTLLLLVGHTGGYACILKQRRTAKLLG